MSSLTQVAISSRKTIRYAILFIIFLTVGRVLWGVGVSIFLTFFPPGPKPPTVGFGTLTKIPFPNNNVHANLNFSLETATGNFPDTPTQAKVYLMPKISPNLLSLETAKSVAQRLGFNDQSPVAETDTVFKFVNPNFPSNLRTNIITGAFSVSYDLVADRSPIFTRPLAAELAAEKFRGFLSAANIYPKDYADGPMTFSYLKLESGSLVKVLALSEADLTKINLFRKPYDKLPSLTASPKQSNIWGIISGSTQHDQSLVASEYHYYPVDESRFETYPLLTPQEAFDKLKTGKEYIASLGQYKDGDSLKIRKVYLAYYDPDVASDFYEPVYVFDSNDVEPDKSFVGYVPAVTNEYYGGQ